MSTADLIYNAVVKKMAEAGVDLSPSLTTMQKSNAVLAELSTMLFATQESEGVWRLLVRDPSFSEDDRMQAQVMIHAEPDEALNVSIWAATMYNEDAPQAKCSAPWGDLTCPF